LTCNPFATQMRTGVAPRARLCPYHESCNSERGVEKDYTLMSQNATAFPGVRKKIVSLTLTNKLVPTAFLFLIRGLRAPARGAPKCTLSICPGRELGLPERQKKLEGLSGCRVVFMRKILESDDPMNTVRAEDAELPLVIAAKIDQTATTPAGTGQRHLVDRSNALPVFILKQHDRLTRHRGRQA
jgi:hypothetical protein